MILQNLPKDIVVRFERRWMLQCANAVATSDSRLSNRLPAMTERLSIADQPQRDASACTQELI